MELSNGLCDGVRGGEMCDIVQMNVERLTLVE